MTAIRHIFPHAACRGESLEDEVAVFAGNSRHWLSWYTSRQTRYEGWFVSSATLANSFIKLIERVEPVNHDQPAGRPTSITNSQDAVFFEYQSQRKLGLYPHAELPALSLVTKGSTGLAVSLDIRSIYNFPELGRRYELSEQEGLLVTYQDPTFTYPIYVHFRFSGKAAVEDRWEKVSYPRDASRHSAPSELYIFKLGTIPGERLDCGFGVTADEAQANSKEAAARTFSEPGIGLTKGAAGLDQELAVAAECAERALERLTTEEGLYAGLPWFHQVWTRDELIAALGCTPDDQLAILTHYLALKPLQGELPTFVGSGTTAADGVGWLFLLVKEYGLERLPAEQRSAAITLAEAAHQGLRMYRRKPNGLLYSDWNATWMDTIGRAGFPLEIQCMYGLLLEQLHTLTGKPEYHQEHQELLETIRTTYLADGYLKDMDNEPVKRPNVFLAYLLQPQLLEKEEWVRCFTAVLQATAAPWGGLSSLDTADSRFQAESTGENNQSYHNGDSWFFINNLAVMAMHRLNSQLFAGTILNLMRSSTEEILWRNIVGYPGEIASFKNGQSWGCGLQAFSAGSYLAAQKELANR